MAIAKVILNGTTLIDLTQDTAAASDICSPKTAHKNDGTSITGNIAVKTVADLTAVGPTVTVPEGYYASQVTKIVSDPNLLAENIKENVTIFGITGTHAGGATLPSATGVSF